VNIEFVRMWMEAVVALTQPLHGRKPRKTSFRIADLLAEI
jgi:hypothetical protein